MTPDGRWPFPPRDLMHVIEVEGTPVGQGNHRMSKEGRVYETTKGHAKWRVDVRCAAMQQLRTGPACVATEGPVMLAASFRFQKSRTSKLGPHKTSSPDLSKLVRAAEDALTLAWVWDDDRLIVGYGPTVKRWTVGDEQPGATFWVVEVDD